MKTFSSETFRSDCNSWNGYKPCAVQKADGRPDCFGCGSFESAPIVCDVATQDMGPEILREASSVGIVEMGGLGSVLRTSAVAAAILDQNPAATIRWFTHKRGAELARYIPGVDPIDVDSPNVNAQELSASLDVVLNFEMADQARHIVTSARQLGGFAVNAQGKFSGVLPYAEYMQRLQIDDSFRKSNTLTMQEILLKTAGLDSASPRYSVELRPDNYEAASELLDFSFDGKQPASIIGLNIGTSDKGSLRRWPAERHAALSRLLAESYPDKGIAVLSGPEDEHVRQQVKDALKELNLTNIAFIPESEVGTFMAVVSMMDLVVTADTFGMHVAKSQNVPVVVLAGPMPHKELELTSKDKLVGPMLGCSPCYHRCSQAVAGQCMQDIGVERVYKEVTDIFETK